jgi:hypothetical protein
MHVNSVQQKKLSCREETGSGVSMNQKETKKKKSDRKRDAAVQNWYNRTEAKDNKKKQNGAPARNAMGI